MSSPAARTARLAVPVLLFSGAALAGGGLLALTVDGWAVRLLGGLAVAVGAYVALVGLGLLRLRRADAIRAAVNWNTYQQAARILADAGVLSSGVHSGAGPDSGSGGASEVCGETESCATCSGGCALSALRR